MYDTLCIPFDAEAEARAEPRDRRGPSRSLGLGESGIDFSEKGFWFVRSHLYISRDWMGRIFFVLFLFFL